MGIFNKILEFVNGAELQGAVNAVPSLTLTKSNSQAIADAIKWAKWIAGDNSFHYGYTNKHGSKDPKKWNPNAHHNGCYFCGTNTTKGGRSKKGIVDYQKTYCCNPFVGAAWAHGGCVPEALALCQKGTSWNFEKGTGYDKSKVFTNLGKPSKSKLKAGDVLCSDSHVALYIGNGQIAEASSGDDNVRGSARWKNSIHIANLTDSRYKGFKRVHRYNSSVKLTAPIRHGEVSDRVGQLQSCLGITSDRIFGDGTLKAVKEFQKSKGLTADGIVGAKTIAALSVPRKSIEEIAREVLDGKWGNGNDRKKRLADAGYDYDAVQKKVNELLGGQTNG